MGAVRYVGNYFGRKCAYWGEFLMGWVVGGETPSTGGEGNHDMLIRLMCLGWAKFMEWNYPVEVVITSKKTFNVTGAVEAAASL